MSTTQAAHLDHDLLTDSLGMLVPTVALTWPLEVGMYAPPKDSTWYLESMAVQIGRGQIEWPTLAAAQSALTESGYRYVKTLPVGDMIYEHIATRAAVDRQDAEADAKWADAVDCYVRFGDLPAGGRSRNHADGTMERGVSCFRGKLLPSGEAKPLPQSNVQVVSMLSLRDRPMYIVAGTHMGDGSDGEPVLADCRIVSKAKR